MTTNGSILALDVGEARIGVALASPIARIATPHGAVLNDDDTFSALIELCSREGVTTVVVGLPRGLDGQDTAQTEYVRNFVDKLRPILKDITITLTDEAVTSKQAEAELNRRGKPFTKGDIDALAATYILEDHLAAENGVQA